MSSSETPAQAVKRLQKQLADVQKLRAGVALAVLGPIHDEAVQRIKDVAASLTLPTSVLLRPPSLAPIGTPVEIPIVTPPTTPPTEIHSFFYDINGHELFKTNTVMDTRSNRMAKIIGFVGTKIQFTYADDGAIGFAENRLYLRWVSGGPT